LTTGPGCGDNGFVPVALLLSSLFLEIAGIYAPGSET